MLNQGIKVFSLIVLIFLFKCVNKKEEPKFPSICSSNFNYNLRNHIIDSINLWKINSIEPYEYLEKKKWFIDSILAFNNDTSRFICAYLYDNNDNTTSLNDGMCFFYGEKISNKWFFFKGAGIIIPRSMIKNQPTNIPLTYQQLHQIALKEIYGGYLNSKGEVNEDWFTSHFEGPGWGDFNNQAASDFILKGKRFTNKKDFFEFGHLTVVKANWNGVNKDSIKQLPSKKESLP